jgi:predicted RNA binding protein YcfA (HicA-like mRNA interferase family)
MKVPQISGKDVIKKLHKLGFVAVRQKGSHVRLEKRTIDGVIKLTVPFHTRLKKGTLILIIKQADTILEQFMKF